MLRISNLTKHYPHSDRGVTKLSLHVAPGDLFAFIGHNGAGKSTTLKSVCGIHSFDAGSVLIDGIELSANALEAKRRMAYIPDHPDLFEYLTGMQFLGFIADVYQIPDRERAARIAALGEEFAMTAALGDLISSYSHGMKQKLALISAFLREPKLLVMDEPFVGLDPTATATVKARMRALCASGGAVFFSTHVLEVAERLCNRLAIIKDGALVFSGSMEEALQGKASLEALFLEVTSHDA